MIDSIRSHADTAIMDPEATAPALLGWYDRHARALPWRAPPGSPPGTAPADPYRVWLSEVMLQQTTVAAVRERFIRFTSRWPDIAALAAAPEAEIMGEWAGLGYYARARNLVACARMVAEAGGFPETREGLARLPGIGAYTSAAIAAIAFGKAETVIDANVERVVARLFAVETALPASRREIAGLAEQLTPQHRPGDFAQAMMDLGSMICTPRAPSCDRCPLAHLCRAHATGRAAELPRRAPKTPKPRREGAAWVLFDDRGRVLLERRPKRGLLGGMLAFPSTGWDGSDHPPPLDTDWRDAGSVRHVFTHFQLDLAVRTGEARGNPARGEWHDRAALDPRSLPSLMRKVWAAVSPDP